MLDSRRVFLIVVSERLKAFLPQIEKANADLDEESGGLEDVDEDEEHIEMVHPRTECS